MADESEFFVCPACGASLEMTVVQEGITLVGTAGDEGRKHGATPGDAIAEDYLKWQMAAIAAMLIGIAGLLLLFFSVARELMTYGFYYLRQPVHAVLTAVGAAFSLSLIVGGVLFNRYIKKELGRHEAGRRAGEDR